MQVDSGRAPESRESPDGMIPAPAPIMVRWESGCGGKYTFPSDAIGQRVLIQGSFYGKSISEEDALHLESESGGKPIPRESYEMNASAVLVLPADQGAVR